MKKAKRFLALLLTAITLITGLGSLPGAKLEAKAAGADDKRAVWISYLDIDYYLKGRNQADFTTNITNMCKTAKENGLNTVIVQVRAMGDAIYPSMYYPWSVYISDSLYGPTYDPLKIMVQAAHSQGLKIEAWFNPYRLSRDNTTTARFKSTVYYERYKGEILEFQGSNGQTWLAMDPASANARNIIIKGICEVVENYDVDGVHLDDYFYVAGMPLADNPAARRENVNKLIKGIYDGVKSCDKNCVFGISPAGNYENCRNMGADVDTWLSKKGYVDYLMPQIYWTDNWNGQNLFLNRSTQFYNLNKIGIPMYVGLALYRVGEVSSVDRSWSQKSTNLVEQYKVAHDMGYDGFALFRYQWIDKYEQRSKDFINPIAATELANLKDYLDTLDGTAETGNVCYRTHIQSIGWENAIRKDGATSGTTGRSKRLESIVIYKGKKSKKIAGDIEYRVHCQTYGWMGWVKNGAVAGTTGEGKRLEAIQIRLTDQLAKKYDVYYRVHAQCFGWTDWAKNGDMCGTAGYGYRLEAIQIRFVKKNGTPPEGNTGTPAYSRPKISYTTHVQRYGWLANACDGAISGTTGQGLRMESLVISNQTGVSGSISYRVHCQTYGWMDWKTDGQYAGTSGESKRLEALQIRLTGELKKKYDVYYRVHAQNYGWLDWAKNGARAGTAGHSLRLECIQIVLVEKGGQAPGPTARPFVQ